MIIHVSYYGFIINTVTEDGAAENKSILKPLATKTARDIFQGHYPDVIQEILPM